MKLKDILPILLALLLTLPLNGQDEVKIRKKEFKTGVEIGFKEAWESIKLGDEYFEQGLGTYGLARDQYLLAANYNAENAALNYKIGLCYLGTDNKYQAIDYLLKAYTIDPEVASDMHLVLGEAYQLVLEFDRAIEQYNNYSQGLESDQQAEEAGMLAKRIEECEHGKELVKEPVRVILQNVGPEINSAYDEYNPLFAFDDTTLFFTSRRPFEKAKRNILDNKYNEDIYAAHQREGKYARAFRISDPFNTEANDGIVGINQDGGNIVLYRGNKDGGEVLNTEYNPKKGRWDKPKSFKSHLTSKDGESSAALSPDGQTLYLVSRNRDLTIGGKDILTARKDEKGRWGKLENLGRGINTPYDEEGIFITPDGRWMYFASQGHNSMGGFDIFRSAALEDGSWGKPENLGYPVNTPDDEVFFITDKYQKFGYFSTVRKSGYGEKDIYRVVYLGAEKDLKFRLAEGETTALSEQKSGLLTPVVALELDTSIHMEGYVLDTLGGGMEALMARLALYFPGDPEPARIFYSDTGGYFHLTMPEPNIYMLEVSAPEYLFYNDILDMSTEDGDEILQRTFYLDKVVVGTKVVLDNIYFETGKAVLRPESFEALDQVHSFLDNNPGMKLEISGHTDNTGSLRINTKLSADRARAVVNYLVDKGIDKEQLTWVGYADSQPIESNDTPEGREANRRVEFKVLEK